MVENFNEVKHDIHKYKLAITPSIETKEILSVNKIISDYGGYEIQIVFTEKGRLQFAALTQNNIEKPIAIVVNKSIISAPIVLSAITGGRAHISGEFSEVEIDDIITNFRK